MSARIPFRRVTAVMTGALVGVTGALAFRIPASAGEPAPSAALTSTASCTDIGWTVRWKLTTAAADGLDAYFSQVEASITDYVVPPGHGDPAPPTPVPPALTTFVDDGEFTGNVVLTEDQGFNPDIRVVELKFTVTWNGAAQAKDLRATASKPADCKIVNPTSTATPPDMPPPLPDEGDPGAGTPGGPTTGVPVPLPEPIVTAEAAGTGSDGGGTSGGGLAATGAAAGSVVGVAALLLAAGASLFVVSRRRRAKFTV